jgi:hypothetical protein
MRRSPTMARVGLGTLAIICLGVTAALGWAPTRVETPTTTPTQPQPATDQPEAGEGTGRVILHCRDGRRIEGRLIRRDPSEVVIEVAGIESVFNMTDLLRVDVVPPVAEHYRKLRAVIADDDIEQLLLLIDWLRDREALDLALIELAQVLAIDPGNPDAERLKLQVEGTIRLRAAASPTPSGGEGREEAPRVTQRRPHFPVLTADQINLLKVYEVDLSDPPRMSVDRETVRELIEAFEGHELIPQSREGRAALERRPPAQILELMFRLKARTFYNRVRVEGEPKAFGLFRKGTHRAWLVNSCAASACHGGQQSGRLWLNNTSQNSEKTIYTNFLILERYGLSDGTPLINYEEPARSPLLQMALPREESLYPHPLVSTSRTASWRPMMGSVDDRRFVDAVAWINAMYRPRPDYPVTYTPPEPTEGVPQMPNDPIGER